MAHNDITRIMAVFLFTQDWNTCINIETGARIPFRHIATVAQSGPVLL